MRGRGTSEVNLFRNYKKKGRRRQARGWGGRLRMRLTNGHQLAGAQLMQSGVLAARPAVFNPASNWYASGLIRMLRVRHACRSTWPRRPPSPSLPWTGCMLQAARFLPPGSSWSGRCPVQGARAHGRGGVLQGINLQSSSCGCVPGLGRAVAPAARLLLICSLANVATTLAPDQT